MHRLCFPLYADARKRSSYCIFDVKIVSMWRHFCRCPVVGWGVGIGDSHGESKDWEAAWARHAAPVPLGTDHDVLPRYRGGRQQMPVGSSMGRANVQLLNLLRL